MEMTIQTLPALRLAAVPHRGPYHQIGPAFQKLGAIAGPVGLFGRTTGHMMGIYKDDPRTAAIPISEAEVVPAGLVEERIDGGRFACFLHVGPYDGLPAAWAEALGTFLASGHRRRVGPSLEVYVNDPTTASPAELQTEIAIPMDDLHD